MVVHESEWDVCIVAAVEEMRKLKDRAYNDMLAGTGSLRLRKEDRMKEIAVKAMRNRRLDSRQWA